MNVKVGTSKGHCSYREIVIIAISLAINCCLLQTNILHPLATLHWKESSPLPCSIDYACCVVWNGRVCIGGGYAGSAYPARLFISSVDLESWSVLVTPTEFYALTTYHSELVLVGGILNGITTNKLWSSDTGLEWHPLLPSMPTKRSWSSAINIESPEYLVVAGGKGDNDNDLDTVEVLEHEQWSVVQPLPKKCWRVESVLHGENLYFMGGIGQSRDNVLL